GARGAGHQQAEDGHGSRVRGDGGPRRGQRGNASTNFSRKSVRRESKKRSSSGVRFPRVFSRSSARRSSTSRASAASGLTVPESGFAWTPMWMSADEANPSRTVVKSMPFPPRSSTNVSPCARSSDEATFSLLVDLVVQEVVGVRHHGLHLGGLLRDVRKGLEIAVPGLLVDFSLGQVAGSSALIDVLRVERLGHGRRI